MGSSFFVNAFISGKFKGNPACVVCLEEEIPSQQMLQIAAKNGLPETAFVLPTPNGLVLRWFTPDIEMDLCGHATLASAHIIFSEYPDLASKYCEAGVCADAQKGRESLLFTTAEGVIKVRREAAISPVRGSYTLDFPQRMPKRAELPKAIYDSLSIKPAEVYLSRDYLLVYNSVEEVLSVGLTDRELFDSINLDPGGVILSATTKCGGEYGEYDFVSRFFTPQATILEDPVTGSAHCTLAPFWGERLQKSLMRAAQLSERGGELICNLNSGRVFITGEAETK